jgi:hypothetical protein
MRFIVTHRSPIRPSPPARSPRPRPSRGGWNWRPQGSRRVDRNSHTTTLFINVPSFLHSFTHSLIHSFIPSFLHSFIPFQASNPTANRKGLFQSAHGPSPPSPLPFVPQGRGVTKCGRWLSPPLECDDLSSLWISEGVCLIPSLYPNSLHPPLGGSVASPGELPGRVCSRDAFNSNAPITEPTLPAGSFPSPATLPRRVELAAAG